MKEATPVEQMDAEQARAEAVDYCHQIKVATKQSPIDPSLIDHLVSQMAKRNWRLRELGEDGVPYC